ncbi:MAG: indolepyruvate ferredoxin oxidoreductase [Calditrichaeota bacterium]|nr:MAG: indolepyruvate ferredoxin oxidoreductase [Calditrichota bacterium]MBL1207776.1 indolepyruvate ferredoxin oxidoreductase [Calditrichota bacterium]NOG47609.1 indolepyruvate ferredoxin oxidoreductase [Calditrichota bacterium]
MKKSKLLLGDEALALAACDAGVKAFYGYPGTPSTEIFEAGEKYIEKTNDGRVAEWAANEKVAYEFALGTSYAGFRTVVTMKHVGLNVAFDAFVNSAITGVQGGLVVAVADDPSMHSSQNEQDTRVLADFAHIPLLEPATPQEVYDFTIQAFELSERLKLPVVLRLVTRLAHSRGEVYTAEKRLAPTSVGIPSEEEKNNWVLIPAIARGRYRDLRDKLPNIIDAAAKYNSFSANGRLKEGVLMAGMGIAYFEQYLSDNDIDPKKYNQLKIGAYPVDVQLLKDFVEKCDTIYVFEEDYPYLEDMIIPYAEGKCKVHGRRDGILAIDGELNLSTVRTVLAGKKVEGKVDDDLLAQISDLIEIRPPKLCDGCGHSDAYEAITKALKNIGVDDPRIFGDIGCYTLGVQPPFNAINTCVEMGASLSMAFGAAMAGMSPAVGVIGDSTFFHSGMPTLLSAAKSNLNLNLIIMDNAIVGMTGQQVPVAADIAPTLAKATGFEEDQVHVFIPLPKKTNENIEKLEKIFKEDKPSLIVFKRKCIQAMRRKLYTKPEKAEV